MRNREKKKKRKVKRRHSNLHRLSNQLIRDRKCGIPEATFLVTSSLNFPNSTTLQLDLTKCVCYQGHKKLVQG